MSKSQRKCGTFTELYRVESGWSVESKEGEREVGRASIMSGTEDWIQDLDFSLGSP